MSAVVVRNDIVEAQFGLYTEEEIVNSLSVCKITSPICEEGKEGGYAMQNSRACSIMICLNLTLVEGFMTLVWVQRRSGRFVLLAEVYTLIVQDIQAI